MNNVLRKLITNYRKQQVTTRKGHTLLGKHKILSFQFVEALRGIFRYEVHRMMATKTTVTSRVPRVFADCSGPD